MTEQEAAELYGYVLDRLRELEAGNLAGQVEVAVSRGELRVEEADNKSGTLQTPLTPREALIVALRMLTAAVEPPVHIADAEESLGITVVWGFDELEPRQLPVETDAAPSFPKPRAAVWEAPDLPGLTSGDLQALRSTARELLRLVQEMEAQEEKVDADAD